MTDDKRDPGGWAEYQENLQRPLARDRRDARTPDRIFASADRQWAKTQTPICTEEYIRAAPTADDKHDPREAVRVEMRVNDEWLHIVPQSGYRVTIDPGTVEEVAAELLRVWSHFAPAPVEDMLSDALRYLGIKITPTEKE